MNFKEAISTGIYNASAIVRRRPPVDKPSTPPDDKAGDGTKKGDSPSEAHARGGGRVWSDLQNDILKGNLVTFYRKEPILARAINLVSSAIADLATTVSVVDGDGNSVNENGVEYNTIYKDVLNLVRYRPDGGDSPISSNPVSARKFHELLAKDMLLTGNFYCEIKRDSYGVPTAIERLPGQVLSVEGFGEDRRYQVVSNGMIWNVITDLNVIHGTWGYEDEYNSGYVYGSAGPPSPALSLVRMLAIKRFVEYGAISQQKSPIKGSYYASTSDKVPLDSPESTEKESLESIGSDPFDVRALEFLKKGYSDIRRIDMDYTTETNLKIRDEAVTEIGTMFGIPSALLDRKVNKEGAALAEVRKVWLSMGLDSHFKNYMDSHSLKLLDRGYRFKADYFDFVSLDVADIPGLISLGVGASGQHEPILSEEESRRFMNVSPRMNPKYTRIKIRDKTSKEEIEVERE